MSEPLTLGGTDVLPSDEQVRAHFLEELRRWKRAGEQPNTHDYAEARNRTREWLRTWIPAKEAYKLLDRVVPVSEHERLTRDANWLDGNVMFFVRGLIELLGAADWARARQQQTLPAWLRLHGGDAAMVREIDQAAELLHMLSAVLASSTSVEANQLPERLLDAQETPPAK